MGVFTALTFVLVCSFSCAYTLPLLLKSPPYLPLSAGTDLSSSKPGRAWAHTQDNHVAGGAEEAHPTHPEPPGLMASVRRGSAQWLEGESRAG